MYTTKPELAVVKEVEFIVKPRLEYEFFSQIKDVFVRGTWVYNVIMDLAEELLRSVKNETSFGPRLVRIQYQIYNRKR